MTITKWEGRPFDDQALEKERKERGDYNAKIQDRGGNTATHPQRGSRRQSRPVRAEDKTSRKEKK